MVRGRLANRSSINAMSRNSVMHKKGMATIAVRTAMVACGDIERPPMISPTATAAATTCHIQTEAQAELSGLRRKSPCTASSNRSALQYSSSAALKRKRGANATFVPWNCQFCNLRAEFLRREGVRAEDPARTPADARRKAQAIGVFDVPARIDRDLGLPTGQGYADPVCERSRIRIVRGRTARKPRLVEGHTPLCGRLLEGLKGNLGWISDLRAQGHGIL